MTKPSESTKLNPQIAEIEIGIRNLRKIQIFPLAAGPQLQLIDKIGGLTALISGSGAEAAVGNILGEIRKEIPNLVGQVIPFGEVTDKILNEMSVKQLEELVGLIYHMNFEGIAKNLQGLFGQILEGADIVENLSQRSKSQ